MELRVKAATEVGPLGERQADCCNSTAALTACHVVGLLLGLQAGHGSLLISSC